MIKAIAIKKSVVFFYENQKVYKVVKGSKICVVKKQRYQYPYELTELVKFAGNVATVYRVNSSSNIKCPKSEAAYYHKIPSFEKDSDFFSNIDNLKKLFPYNNLGAASDGTWSSPIVNIIPAS